MIGRAYRRLRNKVLWIAKYRREMRNELDFACLTHIHPGDYVTVFDEDGYAWYAEVIDIDRWGSARLVREDDVIIERVLG